MLVDLNTLIDDPGVTLLYGLAINARGQILANGQAQGDAQMRAYLLTPE